VLVGSGPFFRSHKQQIVALAARYALPTRFSLREYVEAGARTLGLVVPPDFLVAADEVIE
jgi:hypothetical protein